MGKITSNRKNTKNSSVEVKEDSIEHVVGRENIKKDDEKRL